MRRVALMVLALLAASGASAFAQNDPEKKEWLQLFNGKSLDGWDVKITGYTLNENFGKTFRVENGVLETYYVKSDNTRCRYQRGGR